MRFVSGALKNQSSLVPCILFLCCILTTMILSCLHFSAMLPAKYSKLSHDLHLRPQIRFMFGTYRLQLGLRARG